MMLSKRARVIKKWETDVRVQAVLAAFSRVPAERPVAATRSSTIPVRTLQEAWRIPWLPQ